MSCTGAVVKPKDINSSTQVALASCHGLGRALTLFFPSLSHCACAENVSGSIVGDPMETAILKSIGWELTKSHTLHGKDSKTLIKLVHRFRFSRHVHT